MKSRNRILLPGLPAALLLTAMTGLALGAAPQERPPQKELPKTVFVIPDNPSEGRDPFFPQTTRPLSGNSDATTPAAPDPVAPGSLILKSIIGGLAIINNHSFAPGEDGDVLTPDGQRQHIRLLEIKTKSVVVKIGNQQSIELTLQSGL